jgi:hypothetical protein
MSSRKQQTVEPRDPHEVPVFEVVEPFCDAHGTWGRGTHVRGDHPAVLAHPEFFSVFGDTADRERTTLALHRHQQAAAAPDGGGAEGEGSTVDTVGRRRARFGITTTEVNELGAPRSRHVSMGEWVDADDPLVAAHPGSFWPVAS